MKITRFLPLTLVLMISGAPAVDEVSYTAGTTSLSMQGVVVDGRSSYDVVFTLAGNGDFVLSQANPAAQPGAVSYTSTSGKLVVPSLRYLAAGSENRYAVEFTLAGGDPMRFRLTRATPSGQSYSDSATASGVAAWLRQAPPADNGSSHFAVIGLPAFSGIGPNAENLLKAQGPAAFYRNEAIVQEARNAIAGRLAAAGPIMQAGGITAFRDVQTLHWGMIEPSQGQANYALLDTLVQNYQAYGIDYVAVAMPFASWDLATRPPAAAICQHFFNEDYKYLAAAGKMDRYVSLDAFVASLAAAVEHYDADGSGDMAGLLRPIRYWQIQNEPEGADCGQFRNDAAPSSS